MLQLIQGLLRKGYRCVVAMPRPGSLSEQLDTLNVPVVYVPIKPWPTRAHALPVLKRIFYNLYHIPYLLRSVIALIGVIRQQRVSLVHTQTAVVLDGALAAALAHVPHVWHIHEFIESGKFWRFLLGVKIARSVINRLSDRMIACSQVVSKPFLDTTHDARKIVVIHNAVALDLYDGNDCDVSALRQKLVIPVAAKVVGMVSSATPLKRHEDFLKAAVIVRRSVPDGFFLVVGGDWDLSKYGQSIKKLSQELGLAEQIVWLGFYEGIHEIFKAIDLLVLPSDEESFGRVLIEAMAARKPVVATAVGGIPEIVIDGVTGFLVPPRSPADLAQAIIRILNAPPLAEAMGQAGRRRVEEHFSASRYVDSIEGVYKELLNAPDCHRR
jgi:glycosyltransferase involved in cell wall biosynthesis